MSNPNPVNLNNLDTRYSKPADVTAAIAAQAGVDAGQYLQKTNNLSDLSNVTVARANLGLGSTSYVSYDSPRYNANIIRSYTVHWNETSRSFPALVRPVDPTRLKVVIRNLGTNPITVQFGTQASNNYNAPSWTNALIITTGQEWVSEASSASIFIAPSADSTQIIAGVYTELGVI